MDMELHAAVIEIIEGLDPRHSLPRSELRKIAEDAIAEDMVTDGEWLYQRVQLSKKEFIRKRNIAHIRGYAPFCSLNQRVYNKLKESFGTEVLELMKKYLADPEDIYSKWSYRFARTVSEIGLDECLRHQDAVYNFVTNHPLWQENQQKCLESYRDWVSDGAAKTEDRPEPVSAPAEKEEVASEEGEKETVASESAEKEAVAVESSADGVEG